eukprot:CAMPEP_0183385260 /NCGR_PEP_ID=MMETSP0370-20130417/1287_1 /TAXON_ID=268820 /ORGANISM="Peridinium aciculiferum, Strain PAER-2" /LENGTH=75 /DNA_ID=CAMNT_0025563225 /DNA_START=150 /DNA_END=377 /DNA_ORIENTATION=+
MAFSASWLPLLRLCGCLLGHLGKSMALLSSASLADAFSAACHRKLRTGVLRLRHGNPRAPTKRGATEPGSQTEMA